MINLHDHAWQAELPSFSFLPALLKPPASPPRHYFYSDKQQKVLRKKLSGQEAVDLFFKATPETQNYLIIQINAGSNLTYQLGQSPEIRSALQNEKVGLCIVRLEENGVLLEVQFDISSEMAVRVLMEYKKEGFWSSNSDFTFKNTQMLWNYMIKLWKQLPTLMKIPSKCTKISLVLSTTSPFDKCSIVWCNQFIFSKPQFYQINYKPQFPPIETESNQPSKPKSNSNSLFLSSSQTHSIEPMPLLKMSSESLVSKPPSLPQQKQEQPSNQTSCICKGCNSQMAEQAAHEAQGPSVIQLRRKRKLPILGLLDEWLLICSNCYNELE